MPVVPWSYSFISDYSNCPHKALRKYILRDIPKEEYLGYKKSKMIEGIATHKALENYIRGTGDIDTKFKPFVDPIKNSGALPEAEYGITIDRQACGFWDDDCYGRCKVDACIVRPPVAFIFDWKTGKVREDKRELAIQATLLHAAYPSLTTIFGAYVWLQDLRVGEQHDVSNTDRCWNGTKSFIEAVQADKHWFKKPNPLCGYCPVKDCEFNKVGK